MNAEMKQKWVEALRSGKYRQGKNYLNANGAFCCLGVLCDLSGEGKWVPDKDVELAGVQKYVVNVRFNGNRACLPVEIAEKYDVHNPGPLITMNDGGKTFAEIADYIEANL